MSKSVLVIDTPENCGKCKFISEFWCRAMNGRKVPKNDVIPVWCPLKPLPEKMTIPRGARNTDDLEYAAGYNTCINEITRKVK